MSELTVMKTKIETLNITRQKEILRILLDGSVSISENKNGSFINLTNLTYSVISEIEEYLKYIADQDETIAEIEAVKKKFESNYFDKDNKEKNVNNSNDATSLHAM